MLEVKTVHQWRCREERGNVTPFVLTVTSSHHRDIITTHQAKTLSFCLLVPTDCHSLIQRWHIWVFHTFSWLTAASSLTETNRQVVIVLMPTNNLNASGLIWSIDPGSTHVCEADTSEWTEPHIWKQLPPNVLTSVNNLSSCFCSALTQKLHTAAFKG